MRENRVKRSLGEGGRALGAHVRGIAAPQIGETIGLTGNTNCAPTPEVRVLQSLQVQVARVRNLLE